MYIHRDIIQNISKCVKYIYEWKKGVEKLHTWMLPNTTLSTVIKESGYSFIVPVPSFHYKWSHTMSQSI